MKLEFSHNGISKYPKISNLMKIPPIGAEIFPADRRTDLKLRIAVRNFANAPTASTR
jgi:hypothetical protein